MSRGGARSLLGALASVTLAAVAWEAFARSGVFSTALTPSLAAIVPALGRVLAGRTLLLHTLYTLYRILLGLALAPVIGIPIGVLMGPFGWAGRLPPPLVRVLSPLPSLAR